MPITINFLSNVSPLERGTEDVERALEAVGDSLDDVARDGDDALGKLERGFRDLARDAKDTGRDVGRHMEAGTDRARKGMDDLRDESSSTAREAAASFDGSAESIGDVIQEVAANAFGGFGPAGEIAGIAAAAGIGLAIAGFSGVNEAAEISEQAAADWADAYVQAGGRILTASQQVERTRAIIADPEQYKAAKKNADDWGVSESAAILAMAGNGDAIEEVRQSLAQQRAERQQLTEEEIRGLAATQAGRDELALMEAQLRDGTASFEKMTGEMEAGRGRADVFSESLRLMAENTEGATSKVDEFGDTVYSLPDGTQVYVDAETGQATTDVDAIEKRLYSLNGQTATLSVDVNTAAAYARFDQLKRDLQSRGINVPITTQDTRGGRTWQ